MGTEVGARGSVWCGSRVDQHQAARSSPLALRRAACRCPRSEIAPVGQWAVALCSEAWSVAELAGRPTEPKPHLHNPP